MSLAWIPTLALMLASNAVVAIEPDEVRTEEHESESPTEESGAELRAPDEADEELQPNDEAEAAGEAEAEIEAEHEPSDDEDWFGDDADDEPWPDDPELDETDSAPLPSYDPLRDSPQALSARHWVRTGIGTLSTGGVLLAGAVIMGVSDPCNLKVGNSCQPEARNRAALVMAVPAVALIAGGAVALGVGRHRRQRLALDLQAGQRGWGMTLRGRF